MSHTRQIEIFCGAPPEYDSERVFLRALVDHLEALGTPAVILSNFHLKGRQIDFVVVTVGTVMLVEVKATHLPIRGAINGPWERLSLSGEWTHFRNPYQQALDAKNLLRDAMAETEALGDFYPDAFVVVAGELPPGSAITPGDFKVRVGSTTDLVGELGTTRGNPWPLSDWEGFARSLGLATTSIEAAVAYGGDRQLAEWADRYRRAFLEEYQCDADLWISENEVQEDELGTSVEEQAGCFLSGPSGCGKSLMAKWLGRELTRKGAICLFVAAKHFSGSWSEAIQREVSLLVDTYERSFLRRATRLGIPIFLIFDGLNELSVDGIRQALRGLKALARRYEARIVVTSQEQPSLDLAGLKPVSVTKPSEALKERIAEREHGSLTAAAKQMLRGVRSGFEAHLVGEIGSELRPDVTRLELVDKFIRIRLGGQARSGSLGLRRLAAHLIEGVAYSLSETAFDEFMLVQQVPFDACEIMFRTGILEARGGRVAFSHEIFLSACAAQELVRLAISDPTKLGSRLNTPLLRPLARDLVAALETESACHAVLAEISDAVLLAAACDGELGPIAAATAQAIIATTHTNLLHEIGVARLGLVEGDAFSRLQWEDQVEPSPPHRARLQALGIRAGNGTGVDAYRELCRAMDARLAKERTRLADMARARNVALRSEAFALAYYGFGSRHDFTVASSSAGATRLMHLTGKRPRQAAPLSLVGLTSGELLFMLKHRYDLFAEADVTRFAEELTEILRMRWRFEPYHVRLELLNVVGFVREAEETARAALLEAIEALKIHPSNWALNSSVVDALKMLGALDDEAEAHRASIRDEVAGAIGDADSDEIRTQALTVYTRMFDHPFDSVYAEEVLSLPEDMQRRLYRRAFQADDISDLMSVRYLADRIAEYEDASDAPMFSRQAHLPSQTNPMSQDEMAAFVLSIRFLARHGAPLPGDVPENDAQRCMSLVRTLIYAAQSGRRADIADAQMAWTNLHESSPQLVIGCIAQVNEPLAASHVDERPANYPALNLPGLYSADLVDVARRLIDAGLPPSSYHRVGFRDRDTQFAFDVIRRFGDRSDRERLRRVSIAHPFAEHAVEAIRAIETKASVV